MLKKILQIFYSFNFFLILINIALVLFMTRPFLHISPGLTNLPFKIFFAFAILILPFTSTCTNNSRKMVSYLLLVFPITFVFINIILFFSCPWLQHLGFRTSLLDLGIIENAIFNAGQNGLMETFAWPLRGRPLLYVPENDLAIGLYPLAFLYKLLPSTFVLLSAQSLFLLGAFIPYTLLVFKILPNQLFRIAAIIFFVLWENFYLVNLWDFHAAAFMPFFSLLAFYYIENNSYSKALISMLIMASFRTDAWLTFAGISLFVYHRSKRKSFIAFGLLALLILPLHNWLINPINIFPIWYPNFTMILDNPWTITTFLWNSTTSFIKLLLKSGGGIFIISGWPLITVLPQLGEFQLSQTMQTNGGWGSQYVTSFSGPLLYATTRALARIDCWLAPYRKPLFAKVMPHHCVLATFLLLSLSTFSYNPVQTLVKSISNVDEQNCYLGFLRDIPDDAPLMAVDPIASHLSQRKMLSFPYPDLAPKDLERYGLDPIRAQTVHYLYKTYRSDQSWAKWLVIKSSQKDFVPYLGSTPDSAATDWKLIKEKCGLLLLRR